MSFRKILYLLAFLEGATVMVVELLGARMIAPAYGTSLPVWTIVLALAIGALAAGYRVGGKRAVNIDLLLALFVIASAMIAIMPLVAGMVIGMLYEASFWISLALCAVVFVMPPLFLLGATTPVITRLLSADELQVGREAGKVFGISTVGGISGTFIAGFVLVPAFGLTLTALGAAMLLGAIPAVWLLLKRRFRSVSLFILAVLLSFWFTGKDVPSEEVKLLYRSEGLLGQLLVADISRDFDPAKGYERILFVNRTGQTWVDRATGRSRWDYVSFISSVVSKTKDPDVLLLGLGGGTVAKELQQVHGARVDAVELDQRISEVAKEYFSLSDSTNIIIDDARHFIRTTLKKYDVVIFDVFGGEVPPAHALTLETFTRVKQLLNRGGFMIINFNGFVDGKIGKPGRSICKTLYEAGFGVMMLPTPGPETSRNMLYLAFRDSERINFADGYVAKVSGGKSINLDSLLIHPLGSIDLNDAEILTDDRPALELMNIPASLAWRRGYREYAKVLEAKGVRAFE